MKNNRLNRLLNSPLFKESSGHEEDEELEHREEIQMKKQRWEVPVPNSRLARPVPHS